MVTQNLFMKFIQCDCIIYNIISEYFSHIIHLYFVPWPMIDNPTSCDKIMYSTLVCFYLNNPKFSKFITYSKKKIHDQN